MTVLLASLVSLLPEAVYADWQGIPWKATRSDVRRLAKFSLSEAPAPNKSHDSPDLIGTFNTTDFSLTMRFSFNTRAELIDIDARLKNPGQCYALRDALFEKYGKVEPSIPDAIKDGIEAYSWKDEKQHNAITFVALRKTSVDSCGVGYSRLPEDQTDGL